MADDAAACSVGGGRRPVALDHVRLVLDGALLLLAGSLKARKNVKTRQRLIFKTIVYLFRDDFRAPLLDLTVAVGDPGPVELVGLLHPVDPDQPVLGGVGLL